MSTLHGADYHSNKPFYAKQSFGYIVLIVLYLCLGLLHTAIQIYPKFEHTAHIISIGLYFSASISYAFLLVGHWHEKEHALDNMIKITELQKNI